jgi:hypothetical protein
VDFSCIYQYTEELQVFASCSWKELKKIQTGYVCQLEGMIRGWYCYSYGPKVAVWREL